MRPSLLTPDQATGAGAFAGFQRDLAPRLDYTWPLTWRDGFAGYLDRGPVARRLAAAPPEATTDGPLVLDTVYLQSLSRQCAGHLELEFLQTTAMLRQVDAALAEARTALEHAQAAAETLASRPPDPVQVAADGARVAGQRRSDQLTRAAGATQRAEEVVARLDLERRVHWAVLHRRAERVLAHFDERAARYGDAATRRLTVRIAPVRVARPAWLVMTQAPAPGQTVLADGTLVG